MHRGWIAIVFATACFAQSPQQRTEQVCNAFCDCVAPTAIDSCVNTQCIPALPAGVTDACFDCVNQHEATCTSLESSCMTTCFGTAQP